MRHILSLSGIAQSGKDSIANFIQSKYPLKKLSFAANLKSMCRSIFNLTEYHTDSQEGKEALLKKPIRFNKTNFSKILKWMERTHSLVSAKDKIQQLKDVYINNVVFTTPRQLLQFIGTDLIRSICITYHLDVLEEQIIKDRYSNFATVDSRFSNERDLLDKYGATIVLVERPSLTIVGTHASENSLGNRNDYDAIVVNDGTLEDLKVKSLKLWEDIINDRQ